jgi:plasmid stability protein
MPTLYVENVPEELYNALRQRARRHRTSISAEVLALLNDNVVTASERRARQQFLRASQRLRSEPTVSPGEFATAEQLQREDRAR